MRPRSPLPPVAFALLIALAGCGAFAGPAAPQTPATVTPAPLPGERQQLAPGITSEGVRNRTRLAVAHERQLSGRNYTVYTENAVRFENGTVRTQYVTERRLSPGGRRLLSTNLTGHRPAFSPETNLVATASFTNETLTASRQRYENGTVVYSVSPADQVFLYRTTGEFVAEALADTDVRVVARDNTTDPGTITLDAPGLGQQLLAASQLDSVSRTSGRVVVTERGLVRRVTVRQSGRLDGARVSLNSTIRFRNIGSTTVTRPSWVRTAIERHGRAEARTVLHDE